MGANATQGGGALIAGDLVAFTDQWWAVWTEPVGPGGEFAPTWPPAGPATACTPWPTCSRYGTGPRRQRGDSRPKMPQATTTRKKGRTRRGPVKDRATTEPASRALQA
jgi:hypothetical protein